MMDRIFPYLQQPQPGSDGNFSAALGIPTLDGLGAVREGAHVPHESILPDRMADRAAALAGIAACS